MASLMSSPKFSQGFALSAALVLLLGFSYVSTSRARIGGQWNEALIDGGTFDSEPKLDSSEQPGLEVNRKSDGSAPVGCGHYFLNPGQSVTIKSKNYPGKHPIRHTCKWFFQGTSRNSTISITCDDFQLQGNEYGCLTLKGRRLKTKSCNPVRDLKIKSDNHRLEARFVTRGKAGNGFQCTVTASEVRAKNSCKPNWKYFENSCYFFSTARVPWEVGRESCQRINSDLAKISTQEEFDFLRSNTNGEDMWLGLNDRGNEANFTWISDGTPLEDWQDENWWNPFEPNNYGGGEHCAEIATGYLMNDDDCDDGNAYVCEMDI